ncbi:porin family protein [Niabella beijingensis]|uniref:porin family protein n=1 Tax=Niabella beijingensis TaxID=2872700 RepID=UPI001CBDF44C|nr:porin family protein [Niabella beijingensis]MBZ4190857.1 porin family protein [Niabella beijingensis]
MKKELFITALALFCFHIISTAQADKGTNLIGGNIYFNNNQYESSGSGRIGTFQLKAGHAFTSGVIWGVQGGYLFLKQKNRDGEATSEQSGFSAGVFNRLYKSLGNDFSLFGESSLGYSSSDLKMPSNSAHTRQNVVGLGFTPGLSYKVLDWANIELMLPNILAVSYAKNSTKNNDTSTKTEETFSAKTSLSGSPLNTLGVGFSVMF